jgi:hypothetical protein
MQEKIVELIELVDAAIGVATKMQSDQPALNSPENLQRVMQLLTDLKAKALAGSLEPANGVALGLGRWVSDWVEPLSSPLLGAVGAIDAYYLANF